MYVSVTLEELTRRFTEELEQTTGFTKCAGGAAPVFVCLCALKNLQRMCLQVDDLLEEMESVAVSSGGDGALESGGEVFMMPIDGVSRDAEPTRNVAGGGFPFEDDLIDVLALFMDAGSTEVA